MMLKKILNDTDYNIKTYYNCSQCQRCASRKNCFIDWEGYTFEQDNKRIFEIAKGNCRLKRLFNPVYKFVGTSTNNFVDSSSDCANEIYQEAMALYKIQELNKSKKEYIAEEEKSENQIYQLLSHSLQNIK